MWVVFMIMSIDISINMSIIWESNKDLREPRQPIRAPPGAGIDGERPDLYIDHIPPPLLRRGARNRRKAVSAFLRQPVKTFAYVDGFNLYYRALKGTPHKWLDAKGRFSKPRGW